MAFLDRFYPTHYSECAYCIPYEELYQAGYRGIIFDIDNTLVPHGAPMDERARALFNKLRRIGYQTMILSNNEEYRVKPFADEAQSAYVHKANKPALKPYLGAMEKMETDRATTFYVGDQLFTDIWGANRAGIMSYRVIPIDGQEELHIKLKRHPERLVWRRYLKKVGSSDGR